MNRDGKIVLLAVFILTMIGIVMIYSSSAVYAHKTYADSMYFTKRHLEYLAAGLLCAVFCMAISVERVKDNAKWIMLFTLLLLTAVLIPGIGTEASGARRWIRFFGHGFQPSEVAKLALIIYLADFTSRKKYIMRSFRHGFLPALAVIGFTGAIILMEPDMGTFVSVLSIGLVMLFSSGVRLRHLFFTGLAALPVLAAAVALEPYRVMRVLTVFNPWKDAKGAGFQLIQSFIALGSGGFFGVGLGASQQKLFYLPESHTDFIFSIIGEELGFLGTGSVLALFAVLICFCFKIAFKLRDKFSSSVVFGVGSMIAFEVVVNVGVSTGVLPTKGLPLPFISYGGSSLVCHLAAIGLVLNMSRRTEQ
ncbi:MAG: putative lipid II flippase FtsW [Candidatus Omnitrophota bacterium]